MTKLSSLTAVEITILRSKRG